MDFFSARRQRSRHAKIAARPALVSGRSILPHDRPPADIAAAEAFGPSNPVDGRIRPHLRLADRASERADAEHATAIGEDVPAFGSSPCVENLDAVHLSSVIESLDDATFWV